ncbi:hypothetical protein [Kolteria novifilia]
MTHAFDHRYRPMNLSSSQPDWTWDSDESREACEPYAHLLDEPDDAHRVHVFAEPSSSGRWQVIVTTPDEVGAFSIISGLLAVHRFDIVRGEAYTVRREVSGSETIGQRLRRGKFRSGPFATPPNRQSKECRVFDILEVSVHRPMSSTLWDAFRDELEELFQEKREHGLCRVGELLMGRLFLKQKEQMQRRFDPLRTIRIDVDNQTFEELTVVNVFGNDEPAFLYELLIGLALLNFNVERACIRTVDAEVRDTLWINDPRGQKIESLEQLSQLRFGTALIKQFAEALPRSPDPALALRQFVELTGDLFSRADWRSDLHTLHSDRVLATLADVLGMSRFLWQDFLRMQHERLFPLIRDTSALDHAKSIPRLRAEVSSQLRGSDDPAWKIEEFNKFKDREIFRIDLRHITDRIKFKRFANELSDLAEVAVTKACELALIPLKKRYGVPMLRGNRPCPWTVCALGKLGGREMGFASDIELLFVFEDHGMTSGPESISNTEFFERLTNEFLRIFRTARDGIFEIDLRLRPFGRGGHQACTLKIFREYFSSSGPSEQFERLALVKLRAITGEGSIRRDVEQARDEFVYGAEPIDYDNIRQLRYMQMRQLVPDGMYSAKHSPGSLVDVEYYVQSQQIEVGRRDHSVRLPSTRLGIRSLAAVGWFDERFATKLLSTYGFLRRVIDALRVVRGHAKDLTVPPNGTREFCYLARRMKLETTGDLDDAIKRHSDFASSVWSSLR